ncbi:MAG: hypothetical protein KKC71_10965 [Chloroflexi bacterium]|nr:hypothetical protein [Chloroflexota bacterium]
MTCLAALVPMLALSQSPERNEGEVEVPGLSLVEACHHSSALKEINE